MKNDGRPGELTELIERWMSSPDHGSTSSLEALCRAHPELAQELMKEVQALQQMDQFLDTDTGGLLETDEVNPHRESPLGQRHGEAEAYSRFSLKKLFAHGGCSEVYLAEDQKLGRTVAIKFLRPDIASDVRHRKRLEFEAKITSRLDHPGVVSIHSLGDDTEGNPFYCMRFIDGQSFDQVIREFHNSATQGQWDVSDSRFRKLLNHFVNVCQTMAYAHHSNIVHRDLKPANVVVGEFGETYVIDWGIAANLNEPFGPEPKGDLKSSAPLADKLTLAGSALGTPAFMSPEQAKGLASVDSRSDVFCLGSMLYNILTGAPPYQGADVFEVVERAVAVKVKPIDRKVGRVPPALIAICNRAMQSEPAHRYATASELAAEIECYLADQPVAAWPDSWATKLSRFLKKHRTAFSTGFAAVVVALVLSIIGVVVLLDYNRRLAKGKLETTAALTQANERLYLQQIALANAELMNGNIGRAVTILNGCPNALREWEWHHLDWLVERDRPDMSFELPGSLIHAFDDNGVLLVVAGKDGTVAVIELDSQTQRCRYQLDMEIEDLALSTDGKTFVAVGSVQYEGRRRGAVYRAETATGKKLALRRAHGKLATCVDVSADGRYWATGGTSGRIRIRDTESLLPVAKQIAHDDEIHDIRFRPDRAPGLLTAAADGRVRVWEYDPSALKPDTPATLQMVEDRKCHPGGVRSMALNGATLATTGVDRLIRIWRHPSSEALEPGLVEQKIEWLQQSPDVLVGHGDQVLTLDISEDGRQLVSGGLDRSLRLWDVKSRRPVATIRRHTSHIFRTAFDRSGQYLISAGDDHRVNIWTMKRFRRMQPTGAQVRFAGAGYLLAAINDESIDLWDAGNNRPVLRTAKHDSVAVNMILDPTGKRVASLRRNGTTVVFDTVSGDEVIRLSNDGTIALCGLFEERANRMVVGYGNGTVIVWDLATGDKIKTIEIGKSVQRMVSTHEDGGIITAHPAGQLAAINCRGDEGIAWIDAHSNSKILGLAMHPDGRRVASAGKDGMIRLWNVADRSMIRQMEFGSSWLNCIEFTPDGKRLLSGSEHTVTFWDHETGDEMLSMSVNRCIHDLSFSADGKYLAVAGEDPFIRIWEGKMTDNATDVSR